MLDIFEVLAHVAPVNKAMVGLNGERQPNPCTFIKEFAPGDPRYGIGARVVHCVLQAGEADPGYCGKIEIIVSARYVLHRGRMLHSLHPLLGQCYKCGVISLIGRLAETENVGLLCPYGKGGVYCLVFYHLISADALAEDGDLISCAGDTVYDGWGERLFSFLQGRQQAPNFNSGAYIKMGLGHFPEKVKMPAPVLIGKVDRFHGSDWAWLARPGRKKESQDVENSIKEGKNQKLPATTCAI